MSDKEKKLKNDFRLRLYDAEVIKSIDELMQTGKFESYNDLLGYALGYGIEKVYLEYGKKKMLTQPINAEEPQSERLKKMERQIADIKVLLEDNFIMQTCQEAMVATIYNVERADFAGERNTVSPELMDSGYFAGLPEYYQHIKDVLTERFNRKLQNTKKVD